MQNGVISRETVVKSVHGSSVLFSTRETLNRLRPQDVLPALHHKELMRVLYSYAIWAAAVDVR